MSYTKGPWHVQPIGSGRYVEADRSKMICDMQRNECFDEREFDECDANCRLIAAAPELLEALEIARGIIIEHHNHSLMRSEHNACPFCSSRDGDSKLNKIASAIAKAKPQP